MKGLLIGLGLCYTTLTCANYHISHDVILLDQDKVVFSKIDGALSDTEVVISPDMNYVIRRTPFSTSMIVDRDRDGKADYLLKDGLFEENVFERRKKEHKAVMDEADSELQKQYRRFKTLFDLYMSRDAVRL